MEKEERMKVEAIRLSLGRLEAVGLSAKEVLEETTRYLFDLYQRTHQVEYLIRAGRHIRAYVELGFLYEDHRDFFYEIQTSLKKERLDISYMEEYRCKKVLVNKSQIRNILGRWNPKSHSMSINDAVIDIILKVQNHQLGCYNYWTEQKCGKENRRFEYELYILEDESLLYDVYKNYYYTLERDKNVKDCGGG